MTKENKKTLLPKSTLIIRLVAGMYLIYLAFELFMGLNAAEGAPIGVSIASAVVFAVCGVILVIFNAKAFLQGSYQGGSKDSSKTEV